MKAADCGREFSNPANFTVLYILYCLLFIFFTGKKKETLARAHIHTDLSCASQRSSVSQIQLALSILPTFKSPAGFLNTEQRYLFTPFVHFLLSCFQKKLQLKIQHMIKARKWRQHISKCWWVVSAVYIPSLIESFIPFYRPAVSTLPRYNPEADTGWVSGEGREGGRKTSESSSGFLSILDE